MCMNGLLVIMAFGLLFGLWLRLSLCYRVIMGLVISCSKIGQKPAKNKVPPKYMCKRKNDQ